MTEEEILTPSQVIDKYRSALAEATTIKRAESCLDRALQLLPFNAAKENLQVFQLYDKRVAEMRGASDAFVVRRLTITTQDAEGPQDGGQ